MSQSLEKIQITLEVHPDDVPHLARYAKQCTEFRDRHLSKAQVVGEITQAVKKAMQTEITKSSVKV